MSEPFAFLDEGDEEFAASSGIAWLPVSFASVAVAGFLSIPILGLLKPGKSENEWSKYDQADTIEVGLDSDLIKSAQPESLLTPDPDDLSEALISVNETLANMGSNYIPTSTTAKRTIPAIDPEAKSVAAKAERPRHEIIAQPGDTLYGIARRTGSTHHEIARINRIKPDSTIKIGQVLRVPGHAPDQTPVMDTPPGPVFVGANDSIALKPVVPKIVTPRPESAQPFAQRPVLSPVTYLTRAPAQPKSLPDPEYEAVARPKEANSLEKWGHVIAYRVQGSDNIDKIAEAHATTSKEIIKLNGRTTIGKGEMLVVPVDNCLLKND